MTPTAATTARDSLHRLVDKLPESEVRRAERVLAALAEPEPDPLLAALERAPFDDEPDDDDSDGGLTEAREQADRGEVIPHEDVKRRWGLS